MSLSSKFGRFVLTAASCFTVVGSAAAHVPPRDAVTLIQLAREASLAVDHVTYEFEYLGVGISAGRFIGDAQLAKGGIEPFGRYRVSATMAARPTGYEDFPTRFQLANDGDRSFLLDEVDGVLETGSIEAGADQLNRHAVFVVLSHLVQEDPFRPELQFAVETSWEGTGWVDGVECDVIHVRFDPRTSLGETFWYFGVRDHLPRRQVSMNIVNGQLSSFMFTLRSLDVTTPIEPGVFRLSPADGIQVNDADQRHTELGAQAPFWEARTPDGTLVSTNDLLGQVVVLDFWVTWCPLCEAMMPGIQQMSEEMKNRPVRVFGVNVWESGDPVGHMKEKGFTYGLLLRGEPLADLFKIAWQPAVVVIGPDGRIVYKDFGASADRNQKLRDAVLSALR